MLIVPSFGSKGWEGCGVCPRPPFEPGSRHCGGRHPTGCPPAALLSPPVFPSFWHGSYPTCGLGSGLYDVVLFFSWWYYWYTKQALQAAGCDQFNFKIARGGSGARAFQPLPT
ncbi:hypothetical protein CGRA01v4_05013 [Colletotrichum graminicola]|nr:hypothetical protein CGRA01v4_05013 [Colletotrichum graminicola]